MKQTARKGSYMNVEIAQRLAEMRRAKGYSQEELAEKLGLSRQAVSKWERAESSPDTGNIIALAKLYGVTIDELLRIDDDVLDDVAFESRDRAAADAQPSTVRSQAAAEPAQAASAPEQAPAQTQAQAAAASPVRAAAEAACPQAPGCPTPPPGFVPPEYGAPHGAGPAAQPQPPHAAYQQAAYQHPASPVQAEAAYQQAANQPQPQTPGCPPAAPQKRKHGPWTTFPYPILCVIVFLLAGFFLSAWHPAWVVFLTIPLYYWIANVIENDPVYRERTER